MNKNSNDAAQNSSVPRTESKPTPTEKAAPSKRTQIIRERQRSGSGEVTAIMVSRTASDTESVRLREDIWTAFPNIHLRVLNAEKGGVEIQICDCGMSGRCRPQAWATIEKHNRNVLADAIRLDKPKTAKLRVRGEYEGRDY